MRKVFIEFRGCSSDFGKVVPGTGWEIMVLNMITKIKIEEVPWAKIVICLHAFDELKVFCNGMGSCWMRANRDKGNKSHIKDCIDTPEFQD